MKIFVVADPDTFLTFALAGVNGRGIKSETEIPAVLENLDRKSIGLVLITEELAEKNRQVIDQMLLKPGEPLIAEIPGIKGPLAEKHKTAERLLALLKG